MSILYRWAIGSVLILVLLGGVWLHGRSNGAAGERAKWEAAMVAEKTRQDKVIRMVESQAAKRVAESEAESAALTLKVEELEKEVEADASRNKTVDAKLKRQLEAIR